MSKKAARPQTARHVMLYDEDWEYLETRFGQAGLHPVGVSNVIKALVHSRVLTWREAENALLMKRESMEQQDGYPTNIVRLEGGDA